MNKLLVFASGTKDGGGSGFENLVKAQRAGIIKAEVVGVVSNHESGGVRQKADDLGIKFVHFEGPYTAEEYQRIVAETGADYVALSGWLRLVLGLDPRRTFNIHPGPLPKFGGAGMYGIHVHEAVLESYKKGEITNTEVTMHFVTEKYDEGPVFFRYPVVIEENDTPESLQERVNKVEHERQPKITDMVVNGEISWDGKDPESLKVPEGYRYI